MNALDKCLIRRRLPRAFLVHLLFKLYQFLVLLYPFEYLSHLLAYLAPISSQLDLFLLECGLYTFLLIYILYNDGLILLLVFLETFFDTDGVVGGFLRTELLINGPPICYQVTMFMHLGRGMGGIKSE